MTGFAPAALHKQVEEIRPGSLILVPELLKAWVSYLSSSAMRAPDGLEYVAVGGSRVAHESLLAARRLGIPAYQGYGLTECGSVVSVNCPGDDRADVGRPLAHVQVAIKDEEIHVTTRAFLGYLGDKQPAGGKAFATGDLGHLDDDHLTLSGRRKNVLITSFGRNISPEWVESVLVAEPQIVQAVVAGDGKGVLSAVIVPLRGATSSDLSLAVVRANESLPDYARIGPWLAAPPFTFENGQATGNGRPVRSSILDAYASELAALYQEESQCRSMNN
jgi:acyl-CoA synthetase (AMP-forming)/AMP-acid ligase II